MSPHGRQKGESLSVQRQGPPVRGFEPPIDLPRVDITRRFVRVLEQRSDGLVSFEFSLGWPELALELMLPAAAFQEFCRVNAVTLLVENKPPARGHPEETES